jgi:hypothetical protein
MESQRSIPKTIQVVAALQIGGFWFSYYIRPSTITFIYNPKGVKGL